MIEWLIFFFSGRTWIFWRTWCYWRHWIAGKYI